MGTGDVCRDWRLLWRLDFCRENVLPQEDVVDDNVDEATFKSSTSGLFWRLETFMETFRRKNVLPQEDVVDDVDEATTAEEEGDVVEDDGLLDVVTTSWSIPVLVRL